MDFFERQDKARRSTKVLVIYFVAGVAMLTVAVYLAVAVVFIGVDSQKRHRHRPSYSYSQAEAPERPSLWNPQLFLGVTLGTLAIIIIGSLTKTMQLSAGGSAVSTMMGGRPVNPSTTDLDERKLLNVVEEMALASGVPVPGVYVMDDEEGINAFAAGHATSDATVTVTRGCMKLLTRDELQGVIAHEFSHILNGDMRLNLRLMGTIFGILCLTVVGRVLLRTRGRKNPLPVLGLILIVLGWIGVFFGRLIQAAVSRQREFLADASSVQFTRNPGGISGALKKIGGLGGEGSRLDTAHAQEASHMFFGNGMGQPLFGLLATHPPLEERIRAIDPHFDGKFPHVQHAPGAHVPAGLEGLSPQEIAMVSDLVPAARRASPPRNPPPLRIPPPIPMQAVMPDLGTPTTAHLRYAEDLRNSFPPAVRDAARDPLGASAMVYGLLMSSDDAIRAKQLQLLANSSAATRRETERLLPHLDPVALNAKLPLVDLALPGLRHFSPAQYAEFSAVLHQLIECDGEIDLFEYVLQKIVLRHLDPHFNGARKPMIQYYAIKPLAMDCAVLLSALAHAGTDDPAKAPAAFRHGAQILSYQAQTELAFIPSDQCDLPQVNAALNRLSQAVPQIKKNVLNACAQTVAADGVIQEMEAELLRAVADTLDCPMPPFIQPKEAA